MPTRKKYTEEYKQNALELVRELGSFVGAAKQLGIRDSVLHGWAKKYDFSLHSSKVENKQRLKESEEIRRLKKENTELKKVNHILSKAAAFFSQGHLK